MLTNLVDNAISFSPPSGRVTVAARRSGASVQVTVTDQGPGIPADRLQEIFDRFYSDRPETDQKRGKNSGLGLSISREIVTAHNGRIWAENVYTSAALAEPSGSTGVGDVAPIGARFTVELPAAHASVRGVGAANGRRT